MPDKRNRAKRRKQKVIDKGLPELVKRKAEDKAEIASWNRDPLKHYVRRNGWGKIIRTYTNKQKALKLGRTWKYLTFPGPNALDIGLLYKSNLLDKTKDGKLSVAICDKENAEKVALHLEKFGGVLAYSSEELNVALENRKNPLVKEFPFDVINLDFCNSLISPNRGNMQALDHVFQLQRGQSFLLLLTARIDLQQKEEHFEIIVDNLENEEGFREAYQFLYETDDPEACLEDYTNFTQIVFSKVIARYGRTFGYRTLEYFVARYRKPGGFDMVSHSFEFEPLGRRREDYKYKPRFKILLPRDRTEIILLEKISTRIQYQAVKEYRSFIKLLPKRGVINVNQVLENNENLKNDLQTEVDDLNTWMQS